MKYRKPMEEPEERQPHYAQCDKCGQDYLYPTVKGSKPDVRIIGRTERGGYVCKRCYEHQPEFDWKEKARLAFVEAHKADMWAALIQAAHTLKGAPKEEWVEFMGLLKQHARSTGGAFGGLPYDKNVRQDIAEPA